MWTEGNWRSDVCLHCKIWNNSSIPAFSVGANSDAQWDILNTNIIGYFAVHQSMWEMVWERIPLQPQPYTHSTVMKEPRPSSLAECRESQVQEAYGSIQTSWKGSPAWGNGKVPGCIWTPLRRSWAQKLCVIIFGTSSRSVVSGAYFVSSTWKRTTSFLFPVWPSRSYLQTANSLPNVR